MRSHAQIIAAAGGYRALAAKLGLSAERVRFWERRKAIPPTHWVDVAGAKVATLKELAEAARARDAA